MSHSSNNVLPSQRIVREHSNVNAFSCLEIAWNWLPVNCVSDMGHGQMKILIYFFLIAASYSSLIREMFQSKVTRTGSIAPSIRQRATRKSRKQSVKNTNDAFEFFRKKRMSERESLVGKDLILSETIDRGIASI